jgi:hypothetical protein
VSILDGEPEDDDAPPSVRLPQTEAEKLEHEADELLARSGVSVVSRGRITHVVVDHRAIRRERNQQRAADEREAKRQRAAVRRAEQKVARALGRDATAARNAAIVEAVHGGMSLEAAASQWKLARSSIKKFVRRAERWS